MRDARTLALQNIVVALEGERPREPGWGIVGEAKGASRKHSRGSIWRRFNMFVSMCECELFVAHILTHPHTHKQRLWNAKR